MTCCPLQDTNDDIGYEDADSTNLIAFDYYNSAPACCTNEVEVYELHGKVYITISLYCQSNVITMHLIICKGLTMYVTAKYTSLMETCI